MGPMIHITVLALVRHYFLIRRYEIHTTYNTTFYYTITKWLKAVVYDDFVISILYTDVVVCIAKITKTHLRNTMEN